MLKIIFLHLSFPTQITLGKILGSNVLKFLLFSRIVAAIPRNKNASSIRIRFSKIPRSQFVDKKCDYFIHSVHPKNSISNLNSFPICQGNTTYCIREIVEQENQMPQKKFREQDFLFFSFLSVFSWDYQMNNFADNLFLLSFSIFCRLFSVIFSF